MKRNILCQTHVGDIIKIQNHILGKTQLDQPYKMLAADVNMDGSVKVRYRGDPQADTGQDREVQCRTVLEDI